ncbi:MAG: sigma 54-interacting transcriptional regulator [Acidobacteriota bacterium]|nr:sigma 54-interacting transcriptional regulator [Acidobacteriota bacterium]
MNPHFADLTTADDSNGEKDETARNPSIPALTIISHPQLGRAGQSSFLARKGITSLSRVEPEFRAPEQTFGEPLADPFLSRKPIYFESLPDGSLRIDNTQVGKRLIVSGHPCDGKVLLERKRVEAGVVLQLADRICLYLHTRQMQSEPMLSNSALIGVGDAMFQLRREIKRVADLRIPVILRGASGTGKELVAAAIAAGQGDKKPFVRVNMAAIPPNLAASELFGVVRGAFTGADRDRQGFFAAADRGTLFMDEIGEIPSEIQPLLLRALETGEIQAVGAREVRRVNVRVIAATDSDLDELVADGRFRAPLLHRLSGYVIHLPALARRKEDLGCLFYHFAGQSLQELGKSRLLEPEDAYAKPWLSANIAARLMAFDWPGNVRQLRNLVSQLVIANRGAPTLKLNAASRQMLDQKANAVKPPKDARDLSDRELVEALRANRFDIKATSAALGVSRGALYRKIEKCPLVRKAADLDRADLQKVYDECDGDIEAMVDQLEVSASALRRRIGELRVMQ